MTNYKVMESEIFENGCTIEHEVNLMDTIGEKKLRTVRTLDNHFYKFIYRKNKHNVFVIDNIHKYY